MVIAISVIKVGVQVTYSFSKDIEKALFKLAALL